MQDRQAFLQTLYDTSLCGTVAYRIGGAQHGLVSCNEPALRMLGYPDKAALLKATQSADGYVVVYADDASDAAASVDRALKTGERQSIELRLVRADGSRFWVHAMLQRQPETDETVIQAQFMDITEQKRIEAKRYSEALYGVFDEVAELDYEQGTVTLCSSVSVESDRIGTVYPLEETILQWCERTVCDEDRPRVYETMHNPPKFGERAVQIEFRLSMNDGTEKWIACSLIPVPDQVCFLCLRDITDSKRAARIVAESAVQQVRRADDERDRILMERTGLCVFNYDTATDTLEYRTNYPGRGMETRAIDGYRSRLPESEMIHADSRELIARMLRAASERVMSGTFEYMADYFDEGYHWYRVYYVSVADESGSVYRIVGQYEDVQNEKEREAIIRGLNARLSTRMNTSMYSPIIAERAFQLLYENEDLDNAIRTVLETIGTFYNISRIYVFEDADDHLSCSNTYEWCAPDITPQKDAMQHVPYVESNGGTCKELYDANGVFSCKDVVTLPKPQQEIFDRRGVRALLHCAIKNRGVFAGYIGFDECRRSRVWTREQIETLLLVGRLIGSCIMRRREQDKAAFSEDFRAALDNNASYIYIIDPDSFEVIYTNEAMRSESERSYVGAVCYSEFMCRQSQCANCPVRMLRASGVPQATEMRRPDGRWMLSQASPMHWNGRSMLMITCTDITEHKRASEELAVRNAENEIVVRQSGKNVMRYSLHTNSFERYYSATEILGFVDDSVAQTPEDMVKNGFVAPECVDGYLDFFAHMRALDPVGSTDQRILCGERGYRWFHADYTLMNGPDGQPACAIISTYDNDSEMERSIHYRKWQENLTALLRDNTIYFEVNLTQNRIEQEQNLGAENSGRTEHSLTAYVEYGQEHITYSEDIPAFREFFDRERLLGLFEAGRTADQMDYRAIIQGKPQWYRANVQMTRYPFSDDVKAIVIYTCIEREHSAIARLADETLRDPMTRLYRRDAAITAIENSLGQAALEEDVALFIIDLDNFRQINDRLGHQTGDETLLRAAELLSENFRVTDVVSRIEGDEFMAFLSVGATREVAVHKAERLVETLRFSVDGIILTASVGAALARAGETNYDQLFRTADNALYDAKRSGRDRYAILNVGAAV